MSDSYSARDLSDYHRFRRLFCRKTELGAGGDGTVYEYEHRRTKKLIAVKVPNNDHVTAAKTSVCLAGEVSNLRILGKHPHIVTMLGCCDDFKPRGPAVMLELCELGDLHSFMDKLSAQQLRRGSKTCRVPENTIWKFLRDMGLAIDVLHNHNIAHGSGYLHRDLKPGNILVKYPDGWATEDGVPVEPTFQLSDFSRMKPYPPQTKEDEDEDAVFCGTPEYAPPLHEQREAKPSGDLWSLGATLQTLALDAYPIQSHESFIAERNKAHRDHPQLADKLEWTQLEWRTSLPTVYRPLSASCAELQETHDFRDSIRNPRRGVYEDRRPYSDALNAWYSALWNKSESERITAAMLVRYQVPGAEAEMAIARDMEAAELCLDEARRIRENVAMRRSGLGRR
ncbi:uncharacterized protein SETTUDRAFT_101294 [Exserohilum turcica Et28A]|uniref:Autophagy-related protein 1 n=1 Tax=Exserohilum turcicum (strain 28A) TaxID=671987 RepID=R0KDF6_EXST2|nr:uncharacterized protein SETTUDRAFT_101294 [Exserohilum turcica Et28A]EOA90943.1 hypothetical protein SETTUDRAFT_101294 [Exserohilum turcica Et28A]